MPPGRGRAAPPQGTCRPGPHLQHGGGGGRSLLGPYNRRDGGHSGARGSDRRCSLPEHRPPLPDPAPGVRHRDLPAVHSRRPGDHGENRRPASGSSHGVHGEFEERDHRSALNSCGLQHGDRRDNYQEGHVRRHSHPCNRPSILGPFRRYHGDQLGDRENCPEHPNHDGRSGYGGHRTSLVSYPDVPSDLVNHHGNRMGHSHDREQCDGQRAPSGDGYRGNNHGNQALRDIGRSWALEAPRHLEGCYRRSAADQRGTPGCGTLEHQNGALLPTPDHQQATRHARRGAHRSKHVVEPRTVHVGRSGTNRPPDTTTMAVHSGILPTPLQPSSLPAPGRAAPALLPAPSLKPAPATTALSVVVTRSQTNTALLPTPSCVATPANTTPSLLPKRTDACLLLRPPHTHLRAAASLLPTPPNRNLAAPRAAQTGPSPLDTPLLPTPLHSAVHPAHALLPIRPKITPSTSSSTRLLPIPTQPSSALLPTPSQPSSALLPTPSQPSSSLLPTSSQHYSSLLPTPSQPSSSLLPTPTQPSALLPNPSRNDSPLLPTPVRPSLLPTPTALLRGATTGWTGSNAEGSDEWVNDSSTALVSCSARPGVGSAAPRCAAPPVAAPPSGTGGTSGTSGTSGHAGRRKAKALRRAAAAAPGAALAGGGVLVDAAAVTLDAEAAAFRGQKRKAATADHRQGDDVAVHVAKRARVDVVDVPLSAAVDALLGSGARLVHRTGGQVLGWDRAWTVHHETSVLAMRNPLRWEPLAAGGDEYDAIKSAFADTCKGKDFRVTGVCRVENDCLLRLFQEEVRRLERACGEVAVVRMYHGTGRGSVESICSWNLDPRRAGLATSHTRWGRGVYFSPISYYSSNYCDERGGPPTPCSMLVCDVVVGRACSARDLEEAPPLPEDAGRAYDTNLKLEPLAQVVCKFADHQFYPAYVIDFDDHEWRHGRPLCLPAPPAPPRPAGLQRVRPATWPWQRDTSAANVGDHRPELPGPGRPSARKEGLLGGGRP